MLSKRAGTILVLGSGLLLGATLKPADVKILGALEYGQTSDPADYTGTPPYAAFIFNANGGDRIEVTVKNGGRQADVLIADGALQELARGAGHLSFTVPNKGPDAEAYYIVFRDSQGQAARFTVELKKVEKASAALLNERDRGRSVASDTMRSDDSRNSGFGADDGGAARDCRRCSPNTAGALAGRWSAGGHLSQT